MTELCQDDKQKKRIADAKSRMIEKQEAENRKHQEILANAQRELEHFYEEYNKIKEENKQVSDTIYLNDHTNLGQLNEKNTKTSDDLYVDINMDFNWNMAYHYLEELDELAEAPIQSRIKEILKGVITD